MAHKYEMAVFIGRFQPWHLGHQKVLDEAFKHADKVLVLVGSSGGPRSHRNPFTYMERVQMIWNSRPDKRLSIAYLDDTIYNDEKWVKDVQTVVHQIYTKEVGEVTADSRVALIGHSKDKSSFYLKLFPQWGSINVSAYANDEHMAAATAIRDWYFSGDSDYFLRISDELGDSTKRFLADFSRTDAYKDICDEYEFVAKYKKAWAAAPYAPTFVTTDAVVVQSGHVLLVQRGAMPGKGLWALPGGFLNQDERIEDGMLRELKEETKIKVPVPVLRGSIVANRVFDDPHRSSRGRTITHAFLVHLQPDIELPRVKGSDDAAKARWFPLAQVKRDMMFEDHLDIIMSLMDLL